MHQSSIVWFRSDLRLLDNVALHEATQKSARVYAVYCFDPRQFTETEIGICKTGPYRAQFLLESVADLRENLRKRGGDLIVRQGIAENVIAQLARETGATAVFASKEATHEESAVEASLEKLLNAQGVELNLVWQSTLLHIDDIPWPIKNVPDIFSQFRKEAERSVAVRPVVPAPEQLNAPSEVCVGDIPSLDDLGLEAVPADPRGVLDYQGGETAGLRRLHAYLWDTDALATYKETRNGLLGANYSSKFSAWLANGSLSPRVIYQEVKAYEAERTKNKSTYWMIFELLWRDYFRFIAKKYGNHIFRVGGIKQEDPYLRDDFGAFEKWKSGRTGVPFIDANMREINATGFMSNRGRQNVASFLVKDLKVNWTWGAAYFESLLIDYDVCSNWCNWNYVAGVGNDPRENRYFNIMSQAQRYDPQGEYVRHWIPELSDVVGKRVHYPTEIPNEELEALGVVIGEDYPEPLVGFSKWLY
jgi:deoxyribodipyrimidine photo-lyase